MPGMFQVFTMNAIPHSTINKPTKYKSAFADIPDHIRWGYDFDWQHAVDYRDQFFWHLRSSLAHDLQFYASPALYCDTNKIQACLGYFDVSIEPRLDLFKRFFEVGWYSSLHVELPMTYIASLLPEYEGMHGMLEISIGEYLRLILETYKPQQNSLWTSYYYLGSPLDRLLFIFVNDGQGAIKQWLPIEIIEGLLASSHYFESLQAFVPIYEKLSSVYTSKAYVSELEGVIRELRVYLKQGMCVDVSHNCVPCLDRELQSHVQKFSLESELYEYLYNLFSLSLTSKYGDRISDITQDWLHAIPNYHNEFYGYITSLSDAIDQIVLLYVYYVLQPKYTVPDLTECTDLLAQTYRDAFLTN